MNKFGDQNPISKCEIQKRVIKKMQEYDENIDERRTRLKELLGQEERQYVVETVKQAQLAAEDVFLQKKIKIEQMRAKREAARLELVKEKRFQQKLENYSFEVIPTIVNRRARETKECQKLQMIENESKKRAQKELDHFWYEMFVKQCEELNERDKQDRLNHRMTMRHNMEVWATQVRDHERQKQDRQREIKEEAIRLDNIKEELRREEIAALDEKRRKRDELYRDLVQQLKEREAVLAREKYDELQYKKLMVDLQNREIEREQSKDQRPRLKREMDQYLDYIQRLEQERLYEEQQINNLIEAELREIFRKQDEAKCRLIQAKEQLKKECMENREMQIALKRKKAEEELNMQKAENQLLRMAQEHNERLRAEYNRQQILEKKKYESDLKGQIKYKIIQKEREKAELDKLLKLGEAREAECQRQIKEFLAHPLRFGEDSHREYLFSRVHPFKQAIDGEKCPCPKPMYP